MFRVDFKLPERSEELSDILECFKAFRVVVLSGSETSMMVMKRSLTFRSVLIVLRLYCEI